MAHIELVVLTRREPDGSEPVRQVDLDIADGALELTPHLDRRPSQLSGGQRQRLAVARVVVRRPNAYLFDEPLSRVDAELRAQLRTTIGRLRRDSGTTTLYVTHDQAEALTLGDRVAVLRGG